MKAPELPDVQAVLAELGPAKVSGLFRIGSLAHGGYDPLVSDVDVGVLLEARLPEGSIALAKRAKDGLERRGVPLAKRYSLYVGTPEELSHSVEQTRFTVFDVLDLLRHGSLIHGSDARSEIDEPGFRALLLSTFKFASSYVFTDLYRRAMASLEELYREDYILFTRFILLPVRFIHTARSRGPASTAEAVESYRAEYADPSAEVAGLALQWRKRSASAEEVKAIRKADVKQLYANFLAHYEKELKALGEQERLGELRELRGQLLHA